MLGQHTDENHGAANVLGVFTLCRAVHTSRRQKSEKKKPNHLLEGEESSASNYIFVHSFICGFFILFYFFAFSVLCCWIYCMCLLGEFKERTIERAGISGVDMKAKWWEEVGGSIRGSGKFLLPAFGTWWGALSPATTSTMMKGQDFDSTTLKCTFMCSWL